MAKKRQKRAAAHTWVALLRGINVLGNTLLPMKSLRALVEGCDCTDVRTYIASGNVIFCSALSAPRRIERRLRQAVERRHGFAPHVLALTREDLERAAAGNPFAEAAAADHKSVHVFFLDTPPEDPDTAGLERLRAASERYALKGRFFYLHTPDGFGPSKLAKGCERLLGVPATARNWRTVTTLLGMMKPTGD